MLQKICLGFRRSLYVSENLNTFQKICTRFKRSVYVSEDLFAFQKICLRFRRSVYVSEDTKKTEKEFPEKKNSRKILLRQFFGQIFLLWNFFFSGCDET